MESKRCQACEKRRGEASLPRRSVQSAEKFAENPPRTVLGHPVGASVYQQLVSSISNELVRLSELQAEGARKARCRPPLLVLRADHVELQRPRPTVTDPQLSDSGNGQPASRSRTVRGKVEVRLTDEGGGGEGGSSWPCGGVPRGARWFLSAVW